MSKIEATFTYDPDADAAYARLGTGEHWESEEVAPNIVLDFDRENRLVGIEVLSASRTLGPNVLPKVAEEA